MEETYWTLKTLAVVCPMVFAAGFVDSVAGGGGLLSLPAYLFAGLPIHLAAGTNKLSSCCGTAVAVLRYGQSGCIHWRMALLAGAGALGGSWLGAQLAMRLSPQALQGAVMVILPCVAVFLLFRRDFGKNQRPAVVPTRWLPLAAAVVGLVMGGYDGFFGPGTGTFLALAFTGLLGQSLIQATGNAKVVNLCSNLAALAAFVLFGKVAWALGLTAAACNIAGSWLGSRLAIRRGAAFIRPVILFSVALLFGSLLKDMLVP